MEYGFSILGWEPALSIMFHHTLEWVHAISLAEITSLSFAVGTMATFSTEDWNHMVTCFHVCDTFTYTLNEAARFIHILLKWISNIENTTFNDQTTLGTCLTQQLHVLEFAETLAELRSLEILLWLVLQENKFNQSGLRLRMFSVMLPRLSKRLDRFDRLKCRGSWFWPPSSLGDPLESFP